MIHQQICVGQVVDRGQEVSLIREGTYWLTLITKDELSCSECTRYTVTLMVAGKLMTRGSFPTACGRSVAHSHPWNVGKVPLSFCFLNCRLKIMKVSMAYIHKLQICKAEAINYHEFDAV